MKRIVRIVCQSVIFLLALCVFGASVAAQTFTTTTVQGTVYGAGGAPVSGTLQIAWPAFTTAAGQAVAAGLTTVTIGADGFFTVNLAPNIGALPAGLYYTAIYHLSDGTTSTEYWVVPAAAQATLSQVRATVMPAAQATQAVNKAYVDQSIQEALQGQMTVFGGTLTGPLYLSGDPSQPTQAADKHYVDNSVAEALPLNGGVLTGPVTAPQIGGVYQADQFAGADFGAKLQACISGLNASYGGTCDARNFAGAVTMAANLRVSVANATIDLPCSTITTAASIVIPADVRNVTVHGCASEGTTAASGSQGGTVILYSGAGAAIQVGDSTYAADTPGFHLDNVVVNTTAATASTAQAIAIWRTQELTLSGLYLLGNSNQTAITLDGTGNYTGGSIADSHISGFQTAVNAIGHQVTNPATTDWVNASTFVRLHIDCPTTSGNPQTGTIGINLQAGDGNTFTGGDIEGCATALHLGANAQNNTLVGLRNENSTTQVVADSGSSYNDWITGGTMYTGKLTDNGMHNSFLDTFHRSFNALNGDLYRSQADATVTNHYYLGIGLGNVRGLENEYITDVPGQPGSYQNAWLWGPQDGASGQQTWALQDMLNNVQRFGVQQNTAAGGSPQTYLNAAGGGSVCFNCSTNAGTGGVNFSSGGATPATEAAIDKSGDAQFNGTLQVGGTAQSTGTLTVRNNADAEVDYYLWPGLTASQKGSFTYKDYNGNSQWYLVKDASNNWALNSAIGGLDSFKAYQSTNSGDTYIDASNATGHIRLNYETGAGAETDIYSGGSANLAAAFLSPTSIKLPGLAAASGQNCVQIDNSGYLSNTGAACGSGSGGSGTVNSGTSGQIAFYSATGAAVSGTATVPVSAGGTGAATAAGALGNLLPGVSADGSNGMVVTGSAKVSGSVSGSTVTGSVNGVFNVTAYGATGDCTWNGATTSCTDNHAAIQAAINAAYAANGAVYFPTNPANANQQTVYYTSEPIDPEGVSLYGIPGAGGDSDDWPSNMRIAVRGAPGKDVFDGPDPTSSSYIAWHRGFTVKDLGIIVDSSTDVSAANSTRRPGRTVGDAAMTSGSNVLTSATGDFQPGDTGQAISVAGAGASGAALVTTIASIASYPNVDTAVTSITLAAAASTTVSNALTYISVMSLPVTQNIGNCGWAAEDATGSGQSGSTGLLSSTFDNVVIQDVQGVENHVCGYFFQGQRAPYQTRWIDGFVAGVFGFSYVPQDAPPCLSGCGEGSWDGMGDTNVWRNIWINSTYPYLAYDGGMEEFNPSQISAADFGPNIVGAWGIRNEPLHWTIRDAEQETGSCGESNPIAFRIAGESHHVDWLGLGTCSGAVIQWDANESDVKHFSPTASDTINIAGFLNSFDSPYTADWTANDTLNVTGWGNTVVGYRSSNPIDGLEPGRRQAVGTGTNSGLAQLSRTAIAFDRTHDFIDKGATNYYPNGEDLWVWPSEMTDGVFSGVRPVVIPDSTSDTGVSLVGTYGTSYYVSGSNGETWTIGNQIPAGRLRVYVKAKTQSGSTNWWYSVQANNGTWTDLGCDPTQAVTTSWQVYSCDIDTTALAGQHLAFKFDGNGLPVAGVSVNVAWLAFRPWDTGNIDTSVQIGQAGTPMTASAGNGGVTQETTIAAKTAGNAASFDANGNVVDSGVAAGNATEVNGGAVPASADGLATNGSSQAVAQTAHNQSALAACATTSSGNTYTCSTSPSFTPAAGDQVLVEFNAANTGSATLNVNSGGAKTIYKWGNTTTLASGDIEASHYIRATYDGSHWQLEGQLGNANATQVNGGTMPASANGLATNGSSQAVAQTAHNQSALAACTTTSSGNTYTCSTSPSFTPAAGDQVLVEFNAANTGSATLNVNSGGAKTIYKWGNTTTLASGDIQASHYIRATYDGTHWQLEGQLGNAVATNLTGTPALPNGTTATTQTTGDNSTKLATDGFVASATASRMATGWCNGVYPATAGTYSIGGMGSNSYACGSSSLAYGPFILMTGSGTLSALTVSCYAGGKDATDAVFALIDAPSGAGIPGTSTGLTLTYGTTASDTVKQDTTHTHSYAAGDKIYVTVATEASTTLGYCTVSFSY